MKHLLRLRFPDDAEPNKLAGLQLDTLHPVTLAVVVAGKPAMLEIKKAKQVQVDNGVNISYGYWQDLALETADALCATFGAEESIPEISAQVPPFATRDALYYLVVRLSRPVAPAPDLVPDFVLDVGDNQVRPVADQPAPDVPAPVSAPAPANTPAPSRPAPPPARTAPPPVNSQRR